MPLEEEEQQDQVQIVIDTSIDTPIIQDDQQICAPTNERIGEIVSNFKFTETSLGGRESLPTDSVKASNRNMQSSADDSMIGMSRRSRFRREFGRTIRPIPSFLHRDSLEDDRADGLTSTSTTGLLEERDDQVLQTVTCCCCRSCSMSLPFPLLYLSHN